jgi:hypothetical protein
MHDVHLNTLSFPMDDSDLFETFLLTFQKVLLQERRDLLGRESVKINPVLDGNPDNHNFKPQTSKFETSALTSTFILKFPLCHSKDSMKHGPRQFTRLSVLLAGVVRGNDRLSVWNGIDFSMAKRQRGNLSAF